MIIIIVIIIMIMLIIWLAVYAWSAEKKSTETGRSV